ncbi:pilus assembly protein CpaE [Sphingomonas sp.]|uniref:nucleotide-binding protein n=1 Tax=Sphingomonas sp. TaxID=28214 RepID=UPI001DCE14FC|nr:pilus assembly protein CpaE [Sphingomonas sp.]MBX9797589.1 pilus assembly protein CpaE [Sphingomonas sp.]
MNAPWRPTTREPFVAFVCDETTAEALRPIAGELGWAPEKVNKGGLRNAVQTLSVTASPQILFVDLSESGDPLNDINALAEVCEPGTVVIATGQVNDVRLYRDLVASGIQDYLLKPLSADALRDAFASAQALLNAPKVAETGTERPHCSVAVIGTRGGVGASTLATSLAWLMSEKAKRTTALLDLDVHFGTAALALDLEPGRGLTDAIENPNRIDGLFIERAMVKHSERLAILSAEAPINAPIISDGSAYFQLQEEMRSAFECTITDLPRAMLVSYPYLMSEVQMAVIVTELTLASARDTIRILSWLKQNAPQAQVFVVANKVHANTLMEISRKDFEGSIERKVDVVVSFDQKVAAQAAKLGKPFAEVGKGGKTVVPINDLATRLAGIVDGDGDSGPTKGKPAKGKDAKAKDAKGKDVKSAADGEEKPAGGGLFAKLGDFKNLMPKRTPKAAEAPDAAEAP